MGKPLKKKLDEGGSEDGKEAVPTKKSRKVPTTTNDEVAAVNGAGSSRKVHKTASVDSPKSDAKDARKRRVEPEKSSPKKKVEQNKKNSNSSKNRRNRPSAKEAQASEEDTEEEYEVEEIVGHKMEGGKSYYLIRWKGYTKNDDTWALENTLSCPELIEKFKKEQSANGSAKKAKENENNKKTDKKAKENENNKKGDKNKSPTKNNASSSTKKSDDKEWEVEKIIDYAIERGSRVFRIRWKGFRAKDDTWEPESNLHCDEMIEQFMKKMEEQDNVSVKELRENPSKPKRLVNETSRGIFAPASERKSKRSSSKKMVYYGDSDD